MPEPLWTPDGAQPQPPACCPDHRVHACCQPSSCLPCCPGCPTCPRLAMGEVLLVRMESWLSAVTPLVAQTFKADARLTLPQLRELLRNLEVDLARQEAGLPPAPGATRQSAEVVIEPGGNT
jgi:hypothetical protein